MKEWYNEQIVGPIREVAKNHGNERSPRWNATRKAFIKENSECEICKKKSGLQVHHIQPFHTHPELELVPSNLMTLCPRCHLLFGHLGTWKSWNKTLLVDSVNWELKLKYRPYKGK